MCSKIIQGVGVPVYSHDKTNEKPLYM